MEKYVYRKDYDRLEEAYLTLQEEKKKLEFENYFLSSELAKFISKESAKEQILFTDLEFTDESFKDFYKIRARKYFENGYGISVVNIAWLGGSELLRHPEHNYEIAVMRDDKIDYTTSITDDVIPGLSKEEVEEYMRKIATLPDPTKAVSVDHEEFIMRDPYFKFKDFWPNELTSTTI